MLDETKKKILKLRDELYLQAIEDAHDERDETSEMHLEREYNNCDTEKFADEMLDAFLDSFGS